MKIPFNGRLCREKILELYSNRVFYVVKCRGYKNGGYTFYPCILNKSVEWDLEKPYIHKLGEDFKIDNYISLTEWKWLYDGWEEAKKACDHFNRLYTKGFYKTPYVTLDTLEHHKGELIRIEKSINKQLKDRFPNFLGVDFSDVHAHGIQVRGYHKEIEGYTYGEQPTIKYDFSNVVEIINEFVKMWEQSDTPERVKSFKRFIEDGKRYGWD